MLGLIKKWFLRKKKPEVVEEQYESIDRNYICLRSHPIDTINKLDPENPSWNMDKVQSGLMSGMLRYATKQEVYDAIKNGTVKS